MTTTEEMIMIANYMDWDVGHGNMVSYPMNEGWTSMKFDSSWDWLMPVIEKIENSGYEFQIESRNSPILRQGSNTIVSVVSISKAFGSIREITDRLDNVVKSETIIEYYDKPSEKLNATYNAVVRFIKYHNETK